MSVLMLFAFTFPILPFAFLAWGLFEPIPASYSFLGYILLLEGFLYFVDMSCAPGNLNFLTGEEEKILKRYHIAIRVPFAAKILSLSISSIRWGGVFLWVPVMLYNGLWGLAIVLVINFFVTSSLHVRLDPFFFLSNAVAKGGMGYAIELASLQSVKKKYEMSRKFF